MVSAEPSGSFTVRLLLLVLWTGPMNEMLPNTTLAEGVPLLPVLLTPGVGWVPAVRL